MNSSKRKARTPEAREQQLINLSMDAAERLLAQEHPPAQLVIHYAKLASSLANLEMKKIEHEVELLKAKRLAIESGQSNNSLYEEVLQAMHLYKGKPTDD